MSSKNPVQLQTQEFSSEVQCLQAINKILDLEVYNSKIKAVCTKK